MVDEGKIDGATTELSCAVSRSVKLDEVLGSVSEGICEVAEA